MVMKIVVEFYYIVVFEIRIVFHMLVDLTIVLFSLMIQEVLWVNSYYIRLVL